MYYANFDGTFDGGEHVIDSLNMDDTSISNVVAHSVYAGLFGHTGENGIIENVNLTNLVVATSRSDRAGGIVGENEGTIRSCQASYSSLSISGGEAGGIVGRNLGTIEDCNALGGNVTSTTARYTSQAGGIAGLNLGTIRSCEASDNVYSSSSGDDYIAVGGIAGVNWGTIEDCNASGNVAAFSFFSSNSSAFSAAGGIAGRNDETITGCEASGNVTSTTARYTSRVGGIAGLNLSGGAITDCEASGSVTSTITDSSTTYASEAGGIVGYNWGSTITDCDASGPVLATGARLTFEGGFIGYFDSGTLGDGNKFSQEGTELSWAIGNYPDDNMGVTPYD
jgi:hypothetical protein